MFNLKNSSLFLLKSTPADNSTPVFSFKNLTKSFEEISKLEQSSHNK